MLRGTGSIRRRRLLALLGLLALVALAGCEGPTPRPQVCHGCSDSGAVRGLPSDASVGRSTTHLYLDRDGRSRVVARTRLDAGTVAALRRNESLRVDVREAVATARDARRPPAGGPGPTPTPYGYGGSSARRVYPVPAFAATDLSVRAAQGGLRVSFRIAGDPGRTPSSPLAGDGVGGVVIVDRFHVLDGDNPHPGNPESLPYLVETDRLVVHAPPGTRPVVAPPGATVRDESVVLTSLPGDAYLVFASPGPVGWATARATLTADALSWIVPGALTLALLPAIQFGLVLAGFRAESRGGTRYALLGVVLALLVVLLPLVTLLTAGIGLVALVAAGIAAVVLLWRPWTSADAEGEESEPSATGWSDRWVTRGGGDVVRLIRPWLAPAAVVVLVGAAATLVVAAAAGWDSPGLVLLSVGGLLPVAAFGGLGHLRAVDRDRPRRRRVLVLAVLAAPWFFAVGRVATRTPSDGLGTVLLVVGWGVGATLIGVVTHRIAASVGADPDRDSETGSDPDTDSGEG